MFHYFAKILEKRQPRIFPPESPLFRRQHLLSAHILENCLAQTEFLPQWQLEKLQENRLQDLLIRAKKNVPYYGTFLKNITSNKTFSCLPPISKADMRKQFEAETCISKKLADYKIPFHTSGSTGIPFYFFLDKNMFAMRKAVYRRLLSWAGKTKNDTVVFLMPRLSPGLEGENTFLKCDDPDHLDNILPSLYRVFENRSVILQSRTSNLIRLAQRFEKVNMKFKFKALISFTEQLSPAARAYITKIFKAPVFDHYGSNEIQGLGQECAYHDGFHVNSEWVQVDIIDKQGKNLPAGKEGRVVLTHYDNEVMPFIRYDIGDEGYMLSDPCPCGRTLPRIKINGRKVNSFLLPNGKVGHFFSLIHPISLLVHKIKQYQVVRRSEHEFDIKLVPTPYFTDKDKKVIFERFKDYIGPSAKIAFESVRHIEATPGGKPRAFINLKHDYL